MRFSARRLIMTTLVALVVLPTLGLAASPAGADAISDKRAQAAQIAAQLDQLSNQIDALGQQYDAAQDQLGRVNMQILGAAASWPGPSTSSTGRAPSSSPTPSRPTCAATTATSPRWC